MLSSSRAVLRALRRVTMSSTAAAPPATNGDAPLIISTPQGDVERLTIAGARFYRVPGATEPYPSVTSVLDVLDKAALNAWAARFVATSMLDQLKADPTLVERARGDAKLSASLIAQACGSTAAVAGEAASIGTAAHQAIEDAAMVDGTARAVLRGRVVEPQVLTVLDGFEQFERQSAIALKHNEVVVWSHRHRFAGTIDAVGARKDGGALVALDWKTSNAVRESYALQLAAYVIAWNEMHPDLEIRDGVVVRFDKKRVLFEAKQLASMQQCQESFLSALHLWRWRSGKLFETFA
jgi:hypothetical protein